MDEEQMTRYQRLIEHAYTGFNARNIDAVFQVMDPNVKWPKAWEGDYVKGHGEVRDYWLRQWKEINPKVTPVSYRQRPNGTLEVVVDQLVKDLEGNVLFDGNVLHIYTIKEGLLQQMDIETI